MSGGDDSLNIGISAISFYFPKRFVRQSELEKAHGVSSGKYTVGLGQTEMAFCGDDEDVVSLSLTVTQMLLEEYEIDPSTIGFLSVGTETLIDKSKSVKTELMRLFGDNTDIEGVDVKNACYGGTQAVFHAVDWMQANHRVDGRYAIAVLADIAVYEEGPARCTGGAGAVAVLISPQSPLVFDRGLRACHMTAAWDFFKPVGVRNSEYPVVSGKDSLNSYISSLLSCYSTYRNKAKKLTGTEVSIADFSAALFHSPFAKLVRKSVAKLIEDDIRNDRRLNDIDEYLIQGVREEPLSANLSVISSNSLEASEKAWVDLTSPNLEFNRRIGNMYTPSLFVQIMALIARLDQPTTDGRLLLFAYGSGSAAALFSLTLSPRGERFERMRQVAKETIVRLNMREETSVEEYERIMKQREVFYQARVPCKPASLASPHSLFPGTFRLVSLDEFHRRSYERV